MRSIRPAPLILVVALAALVVALTAFPANAQSNTPTDVPLNWALTPSGLEKGDEFRLLLATSGVSDATSSSISTYNTFVQNAAAGGHADIQEYSSGFRVVGSTEGDDARDNTDTRYTSSDKGVPIYWLGGNKVADNYEDFYDGDWDDETNPKDENGDARSLSDSTFGRAWTGSNHNGTGLSNLELGVSPVTNRVGLGEMGSSAANVGPLFAGSHDRSNRRFLYGLSEVFRVADPVTVPAPSGLTATPNGAMRIDLDWDDPPSDSGITGYKIERRDNASGSSWSDLVADTDSTDTEYSDTGLPPGATYRYRVSAHSSFGTSSASAIVRATTNTRPRAPTGLTATANGSMRIDLSWSAPANDGGTAVTGYRIEHTLDGGSNWSDLVADTDSTGTSYSDTGLPAGATRYYRVSAINAAGISDASNVARASADLAEFEVPYDWGLIPSGLGPGDSFRLLFVSAGRRTAAPGDIVFYNAFVQEAAASGHADIQEYSSGFRAVGSTEDDDARDNTATTYTSSNKGVPIYWLGGNKVADDYEDFYDGDWDDEDNATNASGGSRPFDSSVSGNRPFTGSNHNGTGNNGNELGESSVRVGRPNDSGSSRGPINGGSNTAGDLDRPFYGLSAVFRVDPTARLTDVAVISNPAISDTYGMGETIEIAVTFNDEAVAAADTDFVISVGGKRRAGLLRGSGTKTLVFGYTVQAGDTDGNGIWIGDQDRTLVGNRDGEPQNGAITGSATGDAAVLTHAALLTLSGHKVDGTQQAPQVTIAADQTAFTAELDDVTFTLTRTDSTAAALTAAVLLTQDQEFLASEVLMQSVTFESGESTAALALDPRWFIGHEVTVDGTLTATVQAGTGYVPGTEKAASTSILVTSPAVTVRLEEDSYTFDEDGASVIALAATTVSGVPPPNRIFFVSVSGVNGTAGSPHDYDYISLQQSFQPSDFSADGAVFSARVEVPLTLVDDALDEPDESFEVALQVAPGTPQVVGLRQHDGTACVPAGFCSVTATITDNDDPPTLSVTPAQAEEGEDLTFTVTLSAESGKTVTVDWEADYDDALGDTTADDGSDFTEANGTLTFEPGDPGETTKTFTVSTTEDETFEPNETFTVTLSNPTNATIPDATAKGTIENDDPATLVSNIEQTTDELGTLNALDADQSLQFTTGGATSDSHNLDSVEVAMDEFQMAEMAVSLYSDASGVPGSSLFTFTNPTGGVTSHATNVFTAPDNTTLMGGTPYHIVVSGQTDSSSSFVRIRLDRTSEDAEDDAGEDDWEIANSGHSLSGTTWSSSTYVMQIRVNGIAAPPQLPTLSIAAAEGDEDDGVEFTATLTAGVSGKVTATWTASIESDDTAVAADLATTKTGDVEFAENATSAKFTVPVNDDTIDEDNETFTVTLSGVSSNAQLATDPTAKGTILDDDDPPACTLNDGDIWCGVVTVGDVRSTADVLTGHGFVGVANRNTGGLAGHPDDTMFSVGDNDYTIQGIYVGVGTNNEGALFFLLNADLSEDDKEILVLTFDGVATPRPLDDATKLSATGLYQWLTDLDWSSTTEVTVRLRPVSPVISVGDVTVTEGQRADFAVTLSRASAEAVTVWWVTTEEESDTATPGEDFTAPIRTLLTFAANEMTKTVSVTTIDDALDEDDETLKVRLAFPTNATLESGGQFEDGVATITDNDPTPTVTVADAAATEGDKVEFVVTLSAVSGRDVEVGYATSVATGDTAVSGTDFTAATGTLIILAADSTATGTVEVQTTEDDASESAETFTLTLSATKNVMLGTPSTAKGTINDADDANVAPAFTSLAIFDAAENQTAAGTVMADDSDADDSVTGYAITDGADQALFEIGAATGELTFKSAPNFEDPQDSGTDNGYEVTVHATSGTGTRVMTADQTITVTVTDADEKSAKPDKPVLAAVSGSTTSLTATWTKPGLNGGPDITDYNVQFRQGASGTWMEFAHRGTAVTTTLTGLTADTSYQARVQAENGETASDWSEASDAVSTNAETAAPTCTPNPGDIWCGVMTVGALVQPNGSTNYGFGATFGELSDNDGDRSFTYGTNTYTIRNVFRERADADGALVVLLTSHLAEADRAKLVLHIGSASFAFSDADVSTDDNSSDETSIWGSDLDWSNLDYVTLRLREVETAAPTCTPNPGDIWCGVMTVGALVQPNGSTNYGFGATFGELSDNDGDRSFTYGTNTYTIRNVFRERADADGALVVLLTSHLAEADRAKLVLHIGSASFAFSDADVSTDDNSSDETSIWGSDLDWSNLDYVTLRLREVETEEPPCALNDGDIWCGVMTVGALVQPNGSTNYGFGATFGELSDNDGDRSFTYGTNTYTIRNVFRERADADGALVVLLTSHLAEADRAKLVLHIGSASFAFSDADVSTDDNSSDETSIWGSDLDWSNLDYVTLRLREVETEEPPCALNDGDIWCGVMTVGALVQPNGSTNYGFGATFGELSDNDGDRSFTYGTNTYTIRNVFRERADADGALVVLLTSHLAEADRAKLVLHIGSASFAFSDADVSTDDNSSDETSIWGSDLDWSNLDYVTLRLREREDPAADASLSALTVTHSGGSVALSPAFAPETKGYTASVANAVDEVTVAATANAAGATLAYLDGDDNALDDADTGTPGREVALEVGEETLVQVKVTAQNGDATRTYRVRVTRRAVDAPGEEGEFRLNPDMQEDYQDPDNDRYAGKQSRLEVFHSNRWGTVCSDRFKGSDITTHPSHGNLAPKLACQAMNYDDGEYLPGYGTPGPHPSEEDQDNYLRPGGAYPADGPLPIWLDDVMCWTRAQWEAEVRQTNEQETPEYLRLMFLEDPDDSLEVPENQGQGTPYVCAYAGWGLHNRTHQEDAGVRCWYDSAQSAQNSERALEGRFLLSPEQHDGSKRVTVKVAFSEPIDETPEGLRNHGVRVEGGEVTAVHREGGQPGAGTRSAGGPASGQVVWVIEIQPTSAEDLTLSLDGGRPCHEAGAICTADGRTLSKGISTTVKGPSSLTASFQDVPETHDGETPFTFRVAFSGDIDIGLPALREDAFTVTGGTVANGQRVDDRHNLFEVRVEPNSGGDVTITLPAGRDCSVSGAICTTGKNQRLLSNSPTAKVAGPANAPATGAPTISGTTQVGETLTAGITGIADADGLSGETFTYQWVSSDGTTGTDIENATGSTYKLVAADQGKSIKVRVTFTDDGGNEETLTSAPTAPVWGDGPPGAPRNLAATPGNKVVTLSWESPADNGNAPATGYRIEWRVDGKDYDKNIWGTARSMTYTTNDQANLANGVKYFFRVKAGNGHGNSYGPYGPASEEVSATPTSGSAVDLGTPVLSDTETLHHGMVQLDWQDIEDAGWYVVQYYHVEDGEWLDLPAEGVEIAFHGSSAVVSNLHGLSWLKVRAKNCAGESEWSQIEQLFGTNASDWDGVPVPEAAEGDQIEPCSEDADTPDNSPATGAPTIGGTAQVGQTLTANTSGIADADGLTNVSFTYQWLADDTDIAGASGSTYTLTDSEESKAIKVEVSFTDDAGNDETLTTAATDAVEAASTPNSPATGAPTISGTIQVGETLTADTSGVSDADGLSSVQYEYQWLADDSDISGATNATYTLTDSEESKAITVQVSFTDDADNEETLTSAATDVVAGTQPTEPPDKPTGLEATATHDSVTLTWDDPGDDSITGYVILRRIPGVDSEGHFDVLVADTGTAATTYTDNTVAAETRYTYRIKAINGAGTSERSRWSHIDTPAAPVPDKPTGLEATESHGQVVLTWDDPQDDSIIGYVILRRVRENNTGGDFSVLVADTGSAATTYTDDTVAAGATYTYRIKAINEHGTSERSRWYHIDIPAAP